MYTYKPNIWLKELKGGIILRVNGRFTLNSVDKYGKSLILKFLNLGNDYIEKCNRKNIVPSIIVDFKKTTHIDTTALGRILGLDRIVKRHGGKVIFADIQKNSDVETLMEISGMKRIFPVLSMEEALKIVEGGKNVNNK